MIRHLFSLLALLSLLMPLSGQSLIESPLRVMSFNIRFNNPGDGANAWPNRLALVESTIRYHGADLIGVQEALPEQIEDLTELLPEFAYIGVGRDADGLGEHAAIFYRRSRFQLWEEGTFWLSETPDEPSRGWDAALNRITTWGKFEDLRTGKIFYHFNTHFDHVGVVARLKGAQLLLRRIDSFNPNQLPVLVTGDFNATPEEAPIQALTNADPSLRLTDARRASLADPHGPEGTWSGFRMAGEPGRRIDYIFLRNEVSVLRFATLSDSWAGRFPSDHLPVLAEVLLDPVSVLPNGHSHNDYEHQRPLEDALMHGFNSVEVDIWRQGNRLLVTHDQPRGADRLPHLAELYLDPLARRVEAYQGRVYPNYLAPFYLMIDCKTWSDDDYRALRATLAPYRWMMEGQSPPLVVFLSGSRDVEQILNDPDRFVAIDGRPEHLGQDIPAEAMPVISQRYAKVLTWRGNGEITLDERASLQRLIDQTHAEGKKLRLWASPEDEQVWALLLKMGVDYINTDQLGELRSFLLAD